MSRTRSPRSSRRGFLEASRRAGRTRGGDRPRARCAERSAAAMRASIRRRPRARSNPVRSILRLRRRGVHRGGGGGVDGVLPAEAAGSSGSSVCRRILRRGSARRVTRVDPADARIACVLAAVTVEHAEELQRGEGGHGRRRGRANRATAGLSRGCWHRRRGAAWARWHEGSSPAAAAAAGGRDGRTGGRNWRTGGRGDERRDARVAGRT